MNARNFNIALKVLFALLFSWAVYSMSSYFFLSGEVWPRLASGREIVKDFSFPANEPYSYMATAKFDKSTWLYDVLAYSLAYYGGVEPLKNVKFFMALLSFLIILLVVYKRLQGKYITVAIPFVLPAAYLVAASQGTGPYIFTAFFLSCFIYVLERRPAKRNAALYYTLPFAALVWANIHPSAILGFVVMMVYLLYRALDGIEIPQHKEEYSYRLFFISLGGVALACLLSPASVWGMNSFFASVFTGPWQKGFAFKNPADSAYFTVFYFYAACLTGIMIYGLKGADVGRRAELTKDLILGVIFLALAVKNSAFIPIFAVISIPLTAFYFYLIFRWDLVWPKQWTERDMLHIKNWIYVFMIPVVLIPVAGRLPAKKAEVFPYQAVSFIKETNVPHQLFAPGQWGNFLSYNLYPEYRITVREGAIYNSAALNDYNAINSAADGYVTVAAKAGIKSILIPKTAPLYFVMDTQAFAPAYFDDEAMVFVNREAAQGKHFAYINPMKDSYYKPEEYDLALKELNDFTEQWPSETAQMMTAKMLESKSLSAAISYLDEKIEAFPKNYKLYNYVGSLLFKTEDYENAYERLSSSKARDAAAEALMREAKVRMEKAE